MSSVQYGVSAEHDFFAQEDCSGGWNNVDAPTQIADNESPDLMNMTLDERGGAVKRLGLSRLADTLAGVAQALFYWKSESLLIFQVGATVYKSSDWGTITAIKTFTTSDAGGFCDFLSRLVMVHPQDGVFTYTTAGGVVQLTGGTNNMEAVRGNACTAWQNTVVVVGDQRAANKTYVWQSEAADPTSWDVSATGDWVAIRTIDDAPLVTVGVGAGQDVQGRGGLIVCKAEGAYRLHDPATLDYTVLHQKAGAAGRMALANLHGFTCFLNKYGIWRTDGVSEPVLVSKKIGRLFREDQLALASLSKVAAGVKDDRVVFSLPRVTSSTPTVNNFTLEYHPLDGWIVPHNFGMAAYTTYQTDATKLHGVSPTASKAFNVFSGGNDDAAAITARYRTKWYEPKRGQKCRFRRVRIRGRGIFDLYVLLDFNEDTSGLTARSISLVGDGGVWGSFLWGVGEWGFTVLEGEQDEWSLGVGRFVAFELQESSASAAVLPKLLDDGFGSEAGGFAYYGFNLDHIALGLA